MGERDSYRRGRARVSCEKKGREGETSCSSLTLGLQIDTSEKRVSSSPFIEQTKGSQTCLSRCSTSVQHERYVVLLRLLCSSSLLRKQLGRLAVDDALCSVVDVEHDLEFGRASFWVEREGCNLDLERLSSGKSLVESLR